MPGSLTPPVILPISSSLTRSTSFIASLTAATIRSCSISTSSGSTACGSRVIDCSSFLPVTTTLTTPPPAVPVNVRACSSSCACCIWACIFCTFCSMPCILPNPPMPGNPLIPLLMFVPPYTLCTVPWKNSAAFRTDSGASASASGGGAADAAGAGPAALATGPFPTTPSSRMDCRDTRSSASSSTDR